MLAEKKAQQLPEELSADCPMAVALQRSTVRATSARPQRRVSSARLPSSTPVIAHSHCRSRRVLVARAEGRDSDSSFMTGFVLGGVVFGMLGFLFAPQISKALLGDDQRLKLPRFLEDEQAKDPEQTKQELIEKIAQLNASIDEVATKLGAATATDKVEVSA